MLEIGSVLDGKYKILNEIGHGGMSVVYLALNEKANKTWAVKEVRKDGGNDNEVVSQGLIAETEMLKKLNHPNLPSIVDVIDTSDTFIIVMDYIEGRSLQSVLNHTGAQDPEKVLEWSKQLCDVLGYLHSRQPAIIYRDMKPANVMLRPDGQVALIDFGTAREYKEHSQGDTTWLGTRGYAAPEQFGGRGQTDARTDIYCLGATMYHLLTGYSPADTQFVIYPLGQLVPSLAGSGLEKVVAKCCEPDPANRYQSCAELMYALEHVHDEDAVAIRERNKKWRLFLAGCILAVVGLVGMIGFGITNKVAEGNSQDAFYTSANTAATFEEKVGYISKAMAIDPSKKESYDLLLQYATDRDDEGRQVITSEEDKLINQCLTASSGKNSSNIAEFKRRNKKGYLDFQYNRVYQYINYFRGNMQKTKDIADELASDDSGIDENQRTLCECFSMLCSLRLLGDNAGGNSDSLFGADDQIKPYVEAWESLEKIAGKNADIDKLTKDQVISIFIYKQVAEQVSTNMTQYLKAGISEEKMEAMLNVGNRYLSSASIDINNKELAAQALKDTEDALHLLKQDKKTDNGAGTAPVDATAAEGSDDNVE